ncbi:hypothetical protein EN745_05985 [Mesorhizobium sp. M4A.F.Ca.ET.022.05.2.1]|uniref:hypothetical protein n=1 Tax=unclassified Mesorhizobium TaxID=325217 RepID=UPI000FCA7C99|nr:MULTISPECIES: hypothetical protein [unclassified Mesorhizobium]RVC82736.1 hypothetical protein EN745_05985 [Mesorhizobium sp. M4A.F.Ca.ET.022.05.2.1]TIW32873.1 MAG: hypothetical protein E5V62_23150 [Mesorhizobium sp.]
MLSIVLTAQATTGFGPTGAGNHPREVCVAAVTADSFSRLLDTGFSQAFFTAISRNHRWPQVTVDAIARQADENGGVAFFPLSKLWNRRRLGRG